MSDLKRLEVKYIRDGAKAAYKKEENCYICGDLFNLQMHHYYTLTLLWNKWKKENNIVISNVDDILEQRDIFKNIFHKEIYDEVVTLCKNCHMVRLHGIYGKVPPLLTAEKQRRWVEKQRQKYLLK